MTRDPEPPDRGSRPRWPIRLRAGLLDLRSAGDDRNRDDALRRAWDILGPVLGSFLRRHEHRLGSLPEEDRRDVAAQKSLEILRNVESGKWDPSGRAGGEIAAYVSTVARNGLVDRLRESGRQAYSLDEETAPEPTPDRTRGGAKPMTQDQRVRGREFATGLRECARALRMRDRRIWFFRAFLEMPSREIAGHPTVALKASHVDVILKRAREALVDCLRRKGIDSSDLAPGAFTELWFEFGPELADLAREEERP